MELTEQITLPVGIKIDGKRYKNVTLKPLTVIESYTAVAAANDNELVGLLELAAMTTVDDTGKTLTYEQLASASSQDGSVLQVARMELEKKEQAQATEDS